jgi:hypothetical protein
VFLKVNPYVHNKWRICCIYVPKWSPYGCSHEWGGNICGQMGGQLHHTTRQMERSIWEQMEPICSHKWGISVSKWRPIAPYGGGICSHKCNIWGGLMVGLICSHKSGLSVVKWLPIAPYGGAHVRTNVTYGVYM